MKYERNVVKMSGVYYVSIPIDVVRTHLELDKDENPVVIIEDEVGEKGKFVSLWNKKHTR